MQGLWGSGRADRCSEASTKPLGFVGRGYGRGRAKLVALGAFWALARRGARRVGGGGGLARGRVGVGGRDASGEAGVHGAG